MDLRNYIRDVPDFPEPGIIFKDITPLLNDAKAFDYAIALFVEKYRDLAFDAIALIESRGFLFGAPLARDLGKSIVLVRKPVSCLLRLTLPITIWNMVPTPWKCT